MWWIICSILYIVIGFMFFRFIRKTKKHISQSKFYSKHQERFSKDFGGLASDVTCSVLWPLQVFGFIYFAFKR